MPYNASDVWKMVPPRNRESIRRDTYLLRKKLNLSQTPYFPIVRFIEHVLPLSDPSFSFEIAEDEELRGVHAEYVPHSNTIRVKASVYERPRTTIGGHDLPLLTNLVIIIITMKKTFDTPSSTLGKKFHLTTIQNVKPIFLQLNS